MAYKNKTTVKFDTLDEFGLIPKNDKQELQFKLMAADDNKYVDIRIWSILEDDSRVATGKGITVPLRHLTKFRDKVNEIFDILSKGKYAKDVSEEEHVEIPSPEDKSDDTVPF